MPGSEESGRRLFVPFYNLRLDDLIEPKAALVVTCGTCRRTSDLDVIPITCAKGFLFGVRDLAKGLRCDQCGNKGRAQVRVEWL